MDNNSSDNGAQARGTVLIAEDDLTLRDMYQARLEAGNFRVLMPPMAKKP